MSKKGRTTCDCCGKPMAKATAVIDGKGWCATCYKREFEKAQCPECGAGIRVLKGEAPHRCKTCANRDRVCSRCGKPLKHGSLIVGDEAYCYPCSRHFKAPEVCEICGEESLFLARDLKHGITVKACPKCRRKDHITCAACGKCRELASRMADGKPLCAACTKQPAQEQGKFVCPQCGKFEKKHTNTKCQNCYNHAYTERVYLAALPLLRQTWVKEMFTGYVELLQKGVGRRSIKKTMAKDLTFFTTLDQHCEHPDDFTLPILYSLFGAGWTRNWSNICSRLIEIGKIPPLNAVEHQEADNFAKQLALLEREKDNPFIKSLVEFHDHQQALLRRYRERGWTGPKIRYRQVSVTRALRAAIRFLSFAEDKVQGVHQIDQTLVNRFATEVKGYVHAVRPYIRFLKLKRKTFTPVRTTRNQREVSPKNELPYHTYLALLGKWLHPASGKAKEAIVGLFTLIYAQAPRSICNLRLDAVAEVDDGYLVTFKDTPVPIDVSITPVLKQYLSERRVPERAQGRENPYLFPGMVCGSPMDEGTVTCMFAKQGVTKRQLYATALLQVFRGGLQIPSVAQKAFNVCGDTAHKHYKMADLRLRNEIKSKKEGEEE